MYAHVYQVLGYSLEPPCTTLLYSHTHAVEHPHPHRNPMGHCEREDSKTAQLSLPAHHPYFLPSPVSRLDPSMLLPRLPSRLAAFRRTFSTSTVHAEITALKNTTDVNIMTNHIQALLAQITQEQTNVFEPDAILLDDPEYTWSVSPAKGMALDTIFQETTANTSSESERQTVAVESSSSLDSLVFGCVPPRSLSVIFERLQNRGLLKATTTTDTNDTTAMYDLGSGDGLVCITAAMLFPFTKVTGYEILPSLVTFSQQRAEEYKALAAGLGDTIDTVDFQLKDCRDADWSDGRVVFANSPCFDPELMGVLGDRAQQLNSGALFISLGQSLNSAHLELIDQVCLPANGLGTYGEPIPRDEDEEGEGEREGEGDESEDEEDFSSANGLFTFNVYQRIIDDDNKHQDSCDVLLPSITDTATQSVMRAEGAFTPIMNVITNPANSDKARATSTLLLRACMTSHASARELVALGVLETIFTVMAPENAMMLQVCGVLLLSELSTTRHGQLAMLNDARLKDTMTVLLDESQSSAPVVTAGVEIAHNLSEFTRGCDFLNDGGRIRQRLSVLNDDGRAKSVCERMDSSV